MWCVLFLLAAEGSPRADTAAPKTPVVMLANRPESTNAATHGKSGTESMIEMGSTSASTSASTSESTSGATAEATASGVTLTTEERELVSLLSTAVTNLKEQVATALTDASNTAQSTDQLGQAANILGQMEQSASNKVKFAIDFGKEQNAMGKQLASQANNQALEIQSERKNIDGLHAKSQQMNMAYHQAKSEVDIQSVNLNQMQDDIGRKIARAMTEYKAMNMWASLFSYNTDQLTGKLSDTYDNLALTSQLMSSTSSHLIEAFNDLRTALGNTTTDTLTA